MLEKFEGTKGRQDIALADTPAWQKGAERIYERTEKSLSAQLQPVLTVNRKAVCEQDACYAYISVAIARFISCI